MTVKLDPATKNEDIGLSFRRTRRAVLDTPFGEVATWIKAGTAGDLVWKNSNNGEEGIWNLEAGETVPIVCTEILSDATAGGPVSGESTTASNLFWASTPANIGKEN